MTIRNHDYFFEFPEITLTGSSNSVRKFQERNDLSESLDLKESLHNSCLGIFTDTHNIIF